MSSGAVTSGACIAAVPGKVFVGDLGSLRSYVSDGNGLWAVDMNDEQHLYGATDIAADASGVYVAGCLWSQSSGDHCGHFLRKCDANDGHIVWTRLLGSGWVILVWGGFAPRPAASTSPCGT